MAAHRQQLLTEPQFLTSPQKKKIEKALEIGLSVVYNDCISKTTLDAELKKKEFKIFFTNKLNTVLPHSFWLDVLDSCSI